MITGLVNAGYEAVVRLQIRGPMARGREIEAIVDTGFNGFLTLPPSLIVALDLRRLSRGRAILANGSEDLFDIYGVTVLWDGQQRHVEADAVDTLPLAGMSLLAGYDLSIQVAYNGSVVIQASP